MKHATYLLIGGGLACNQAAKLLRMKDPNGSILLAAKESHLPYDRPPLSKELLRGEKTAGEIVYDPQSFYNENQIETLLGQPVTALHPRRKEAETASGEGVAFDKAFIATGGEPVRLEVPGSVLNGIYYLRTLDDAERIVSAAVSGARAVVVGAGFIGMEVAASLTQRGVSVTVVEARPRVWPAFADESFSNYLESYGKDRGIRFSTGDTIVEFRGKSRVASAVTASRQEIPCDFVCVGIGIVPATGLAQRAGLRVDNGIVVDEHLQTSHPDIYAGGDVANYMDPVFGKRRRVEHWGHAEYCGQLAALNMTGTSQKYDLLTYVWSDIFDLHIEFAGDETECDRILVRGKVGEPPFAVLCLKENKLRAYFAVNTDSREFPKLQRLIRRGTMLTGKDRELQDPAFELKSLS
jgi:NADPH-dependent 2,4-dienoyl-CoA reductase/sulfur reductase-like enzyme